MARELTITPSTQLLLGDSSTAMAIAALQSQQVFSAVQSSMCLQTKDVPAEMRLLSTAIAGGDSLRAFITNLNQNGYGSNGRWSLDSSHKPHVAKKTVHELIIYRQSGSATQA